MKRDWKKVKYQDPSRHKFGSVEWQHTMYGNIIHKLEHKKDLDAPEKVFLQVEMERKLGKKMFR